MSRDRSGSGKYGIASAVYLKGRFSAWAVPCASDFADLIDFATVSVYAGAGLVQNQKSDGNPVGPIRIHKADGASGLDLSTSGLAVRTALQGGICKVVDEKEGPVQVHFAQPDASDGFDKSATAAGLKLKAAPPLKVTDQVSLDIGPGLDWSDKQVCLKVDNKTVKCDKAGVHLQCAEGGGLAFDSSGNLVVDIVTVLSKR
ncbi:hypothetical protein [Burkholderia stagnalis]|uniref:hypothetical protein n=1 Tax=Burkholderia stagnalis TaxID=1503054 RepID=UPI000AE5F1C6|nr:hypothetical protein [Burkholderia stagnalis]MDY7806692.1 hypothetical protein [Burkholderia stagnalis]